MALEPFGLTIKLARVRLGLQQQDVAKRADISRQALSRIEACVWLPRPQTRERLCRVLDLEPDDRAENASATADAVAVGG